MPLLVWTGTHCLWRSCSAHSHHICSLVLLLPFLQSSLSLSLSLSVCTDLPSVLFSPFNLQHSSFCLPPIERTVCGALRQRKARPSQTLTERIQQPPANPVRSASFPADVFEEDISSSISSLNTEQHAALQAASISSLPGLPVDQPLSDCSAVGLTLNDSPSHAQVLKTAETRPPSPICPSSLPPSLNFNHLTRPRKPRDIKPKMKKLKYHQYIPPDQKGAPAPAQPLDPAYSHLLKQQQVFLQLQILQSQQQQHQQRLQPPQEVASCGASPLSLQPVPATTNQTQTDANPTSKPEPLPANLVDLTVSELRQQLRKRGLPVSGTKPALLQRLRPFQLQHACPAPAPLSKLGTSMEPLIPCAPLLPCQSPGSSPGFRLSSPAQTSPGVRSLEEELQEAIQKAQMDPRQSIDDILDEPLICDGSLEASDHKSAAHSLPDRSPAPQAEQPQPFQQQDDNFLPSPLCSSLLLELPPSPAVINPSQVVPAPPPLPICTSPSPSTRRSRKRRAPAQFDAADWLETLTSGLHPLTPPKPPFVESDFSLDSDLNVNRVLDLLIEQW
uniref:Si:dkeyp-69b9.3 n=1 Tax=Poecilia latipinna TaxID=48699 RepID=A0A3B3V8I3_9TELE